MKFMILAALVFAFALAFTTGPNVGLITQPDQVGVCGNGFACP